MLSTVTTLEMRGKNHLYSEENLVHNTQVCTFNMCVCVLVTQSCPTLCDLMNCILPGSSVREILQARTLEWLPFPSPIFNMYDHIIP